MKKRVLSIIICFTMVTAYIPIFNSSVYAEVSNAYNCSNSITISEDKTLSSEYIYESVFVDYGTTVTTIGSVYIEGDLLVFGELINNGTLTVTGTTYCLNYDGMMSAGSYEYGVFTNNSSANLKTLVVQDDYLVDGVPDLSHELITSCVEEPTCKDQGLSYSYCSNCDYYEYGEIPATTDHDWPEWVIEEEATCDSAGYAWRYCELCSEYDSKHDPATGIHDWGEWEYEEEITCISQEATRYCNECYAEDVKEIPATTDHDWPEWVIEEEATCDSVGYAWRYCELCDEYDEKVIPKLNHKWSKWEVDLKADVYGDGYLCKVCDYCGDIKEKTVYKIKSIALSKTTYVYDGKTKMPTVTVKDRKGTKLTKGTDYTVKIRNSAGKVVTKPAKVGKYKVIVTFKGKYSGTLSKTFTIKPKATAVTKLTKSGKKQVTVKWEKRTAQVTGYQIRYSTKSSMNNSKYVLVKSYKTTSKTIKNLKAKKKYWVQVRTYKTVNGVKYYSNWSAKKPVTTK